MKNHTIDQYELPEPLIQFTRAKCDPDTVRTWTEKTPKQFPGSFEYDTLDGRFLATPENVRTFVHLCLGLRAIENLDSGCLEFINPKTGTKHPYKRVYSTVNAYFQHRCQKSVKKHFDITFKREAWRFRYSALHVRKAEYADQMPPLNLPQFWAEVKHLVETMEPEEFSFAPLKKNIWEYNTYA